MILATHSTDDATLIPAPAAISKVLPLNATASVESSPTSSEPTKLRALEKSCAVLLVPAHNLGNSVGRHKDAAMCDAHQVDAERVDNSEASNGMWRRAVTAASARTATPISPSRADALPTRAESDANLAGLETAPSRAVAGSHVLPTRCG